MKTPVAMLCLALALSTPVQAFEPGKAAPAKKASKKDSDAAKEE